MELSRVFDGRKFMWDGIAYAGPAEADRAAESYRADGFEVQSCVADGQWFVYSRRVPRDAASLSQP